MSHRAHQLSVLNQWTAAHSLYDTAAALNELVIRNLYYKVFICVAVGGADFSDFNLVATCFIAFDSGVHLSLSDLDLTVFGDFKLFSVLRYFTFGFSENSAICVFCKAAEGFVAADKNLFKCGTGDDTVIAVGFDSGATLKAAIREGVMYGAVTQSPVGIGRVTIDLLLASAKGEAVEDTDTGCAFYTLENIDTPEIADNLYD